MFTLAALLSAVWTLVHIVLGGRDVARPLSRSALPEIPRETSVMVWHMISAVLAVLTLLLGWAALGAVPEGGIAAMLLSGGLMLGGIGTQIGRGLPLKTLPQGWLFLPVTVLAGLGLWL
ncbi:MAG: hypothetical protein AAFY65_16750 [Pseudomonadota bacterium]